MAQQQRLDALEKISQQQKVLIETLQRDQRAMQREIEELRGELKRNGQESSELVVALAGKIKKEEQTLIKENDAKIQLAAGKFDATAQELAVRLKQQEHEIAEVIDHLKNYVERKSEEAFVKIKKLELTLQESKSMLSTFSPAQIQSSNDYTPPFLKKMFTPDGRLSELESIKKSMKVEPTSAMHRLNLLLEQSTIKDDEKEETLRKSYPHATEFQLHQSNASRVAQRTLQRPQQRMVQFAATETNALTCANQLSSDLENSEQLAGAGQQLLQQQTNEEEPETQDVQFNTLEAEVIDVSIYHLELGFDQFTGDPTKPFFRWETQFLLFLATKEIPPTQQQSLAHLVRHLNGTALLFYESLPQQTANDFNAVLNALRTRFPGLQAKQVADQQLLHCKQRTGESVHDFSVRLVDIVKVAMLNEHHDVTQYMLKHTFIGNLLPEIQVQLQRTPLRTYEDALAKAYEVEAFLQSKKDLEVGFQALRIETSSRPNADIKCYYCHQTGHIKKRCPQLYDQNSYHRSTRDAARDRHYSDRRSSNDYRQPSRDRYSGQHYHRVPSKERYRYEDSRYEHEGRAYREDYRKPQENYHSRSSSRDRHRPSTPYRDNKERHSDSRRDYRPHSRSHSYDRHRSQTPDRRYSSSHHRQPSQERRKPQIRFADSNFVQVDKTVDIDFYMFSTSAIKPKHPRITAPEESTNNTSVKQNAHSEDLKLNGELTVSAESVTGLNKHLKLKRRVSQQKARKAAAKAFQKTNDIRNERGEKSNLMANQQSLRPRVTAPGSENHQTKRAHQQRNDESTEKVQVSSKRKTTAVPKTARLEGAKLARTGSEETDGSSKNRRHRHRKQNQQHKARFKDHQPQRQSWVGRIINFTPFILALLCILLSAIPGTSAEPMLCHEDAPTTLIELPSSSMCIKTPWTLDEVPHPASMHIYRKNTVKYVEEAHHCQCTRISGTNSRSFFGSKQASPITSTPIKVSASDCFQMITDRRSPHGPLQNFSTYSATHNVLQFPDRSWPMWLKTDTATAVNCFLSTATIFTRHNISTIEKPFATTTECLYQAGSCQMNDLGILLWEPDATHLCQYIELNHQQGEFAKDVWISESKEFALSFEENRTLTECNQTFAISSQGFAVLLHDLEQARKTPETRHRRETGIVLSEQVAAQLTALSTTIRTLTIDVFTTTLEYICSGLDAIAQAALALAQAQPTLLSRKLLNNSLIEARLVTNNILEIRPCESLNITELDFLFSEKCFNRLPINFTYHHRTLSGYFDPLTHVIHHTATEVSCSKGADVYVNLNGKIKKYNQKTGHVSIVAHLPQPTNFMMLDFPQLNLLRHQTIFHNLPISKLNEFDSSMHQAFMRTTAIQELMAGASETASKHIQNEFNDFSEMIVNHGIFAFLYGGLICFKQIWIFACCCWVTYKVIIEIFIPLAVQAWITKKFNIPFLITRLINNRIQQQQVRLLQQQQQQELQQELQQQQQIQPSESFGMNVLNRLWPSTTNVNSYLTNTERIKPNVHICGKVNQQNSVFILDNGSPQSIISLSFVLKHRLEVKQASVNYRIFGIAGDGTTTIGEVNVNVTIFNRRRRVRIPVFDDTKQPLSFHVLLGTDLLKEWPPILYDLQNKKVTSNHVTVDIFTTSVVEKTPPSPSENEATFIFPPPDLNNDEKEKLHETLSEYTEVFATDEFDVGDCQLVASPLKLTTDIPITAKPYRVPEKMKDTVNTYIQKLLKAGIIVESTTPWVSNILLVKKPSSNDLRPVCDFRRLNAHSEKDPYPLNRIDSILQKVSGSYYFTTLDLASGYFQILSGESSKYYGIIVENNVYEFVRLPQGLKNAPAIFSRTMNTIFEGLENIVTIYMDDLIITTRSNSFSEHLDAVRLVLDRLKEAGLKIRPNKSHFFKRSVSFLGHYLDEKGIHPAPKHIEAIKHRKPPTSKKELQSFLGLTNYFHKFINGYAKIIAPLTALLKKNAIFEWGTEEEDAFQELVKALTSDPILKAPDYTKPFTVITDSSITAVGGAVLQPDENGELHPISFCSKVLTPAETRYSTSEQELYAIVYTLQYHKHILYGTSIRLLTDHKPLISLVTKSSSSARLNRWLVELQEFGLETMEHIPGKDNVLADYLSRPPTEVQLNAAEAETQSNSGKLILATSKDTVLQKVMEQMKTDWKFFDPEQEPQLEPFHQVKDTLKISKHQLLYHNERIVIPEELKVEILKLLHRSHAGADRMKAQIRQLYWWPKLNQQIENIVATCKQCNEYRKLASSGPLYPWPEPNGPWDRVHIDFFGPIWGSQWLVVVDAYSKYPFVIKMKDITAKATAAALQTIFNYFGYCKTVVSDNGPQLASYEFNEFLKSLHIKHTLSPPYHPQSNGLAERFVGTTKLSVKKILAERANVTAEKAVQLFLEDYRATPHATTQRSPAEMIFKKAPPHIVTSYVPRESHPDSDEQTITKFKPGDEVWRRSFNKSKNWEPATVIKTDGSFIYQVMDQDNKLSRLHQNDLRLRKANLRKTAPKTTTT